MEYLIGLLFLYFPIVFGYRYHNIISKLNYHQLSPRNLIHLASSSDKYLTSSVDTLYSSELLHRFWKIDLHTKKTTAKLLDLYRNARVDASSFQGVLGYGHGDVGREKLDEIVAKLMGAESAIVRLQLFSGTHAIASALFGCMRPGQSMLCVTGHPYDTLEEVIGLRPGSQTGSLTGSLKDWNIGYQEIDLIFSKEAEKINQRSVAIDIPKIDFLLQSDKNIKVIHIQRSCGYSWRPSIPIIEIKRICDHIEKEYKSKGRDIVVFVDNCYGELVEEVEPCHVGADLIAGSLIKNLGGTLAPCGGYIAGKDKLVKAALVHLSAPGVDGGATFNMYRHLFQGLFLAPGVVGESIKGAELIADVMFNQYGFQCNPPPNSHRTDIIQAVQLGSRDKLISFCESVQKKSPVGSYIRPEPGISPGYGDEVIFADGTFIDGSTLELSADGPLREPYVVFTQGCTHWTHWSIVLDEVLSCKAFQRNK